MSANPTNDLDLSRWKEYPHIRTESLWLLEGRDRSGQHSGHYHGNFVPEIPRQMMLRYTRCGDFVLDAFVGSGTTFIEGARLGRNVIGVDLNRDVLREGLERAEQEKLAVWGSRDYYAPPHLIPVCGDVASYPFLSPEAVSHPALLPFTVQHILYHPPYHDIVKYGEEPDNLSACDTVEEFLQRWQQVLRNTLPLLETGRYCSVVIGDYYRDGEWVRLGSRVMDVMEAQGLLCKSVIVKNLGETKGKAGPRGLWRYRALAGGFYEFSHEYVAVFQKRKPTRRRVKTVRRTGDET